MYDSSWSSRYVGEDERRPGRHEAAAEEEAEARRDHRGEAARRGAYAADSLDPCSAAPDRVSPATPARASAGGSRGRPSRESCTPRRRARRRARRGTRSGSVRRGGPCSASRSAARRGSSADAVVLEVDAGRQRLDALLADVLVAACVGVEVGDAGLLQPDDERGVVRDALRVRLREPHADVVREREAVHRSARHYTRPVADPASRRSRR